MEILKRSRGSMLESCHLEDARRARRVTVSMGVNLELGPDRIVKAVIDDLSKDGFRLRCRAILYPGQNLKMHLPRETLVCELLWVAGLQAGGIFAETSAAPAW
jgi:hypothetical protein